ncbi:MAG: hypothetical protein U9N02_05580, partial [Campylobacterota bacterium]|nr:hypothetical protein [Campylobacterota bacterium]
ATTGDALAVACDGNATGVGVSERDISAGVTSVCFVVVADNFDNNTTEGAIQVDISQVDGNISIVSDDDDLSAGELDINLTVEIKDSYGATDLSTENIYIQLED